VSKRSSFFNCLTIFEFEPLSIIIKIMETFIEDLENGEGFSETNNCYNKSKGDIVQ